MVKRLLIVFLLSISLLLCSCTPKDNPADEPNAEQQGPSDNEGGSDLGGEGGSGSENGNGDNSGSENNGNGENNQEDGKGDGVIDDLPIDEF